MNPYKYAQMYAALEAAHIRLITTSARKHNCLARNQMMNSVPPPSSSICQVFAKVDTLESLHTLTSQQSRPFGQI
ncbi:hypothetical protein [Pedobacter sp.]|uniref:hypothetical protein n=1 Tax=Pedobacter sp. TaxID=1411316 RepID=UPI0031E3A7EA